MSIARQSVTGNGGGGVDPIFVTSVDCSQCDIAICNNLFLQSMHRITPRLARIEFDVGTHRHVAKCPWQNEHVEFFVVLMILSNTRVVERWCACDELRNELRITALRAAGFVHRLTHGQHRHFDARGG